MQLETYKGDGNVKKRRSSFFSLTGKIFFLVSMLTFLTALFIGAFFFSQTSKNALRIATDELASESSLISPIAQSAYGELRSDASVIAQMPPIKGLMRSIRNNDIDPEDGSTTRLWRARLETIFQAMITAKPAYTQIRYIGVQDNGRELVRVNKKDGRVEVVSVDDLQRKGGEPYFNDVLKLRPGDVYYSGVSLNREHGKIEIPFRPVIRTIVPVFDENDEIYGMIAINATYQRVLENVLENLNTDRDLYIIAQSGDFIHYTKEEGEEKFSYVSSADDHKDYPVMNYLASVDEDEGTIFREIDGEKVAIHFNKQYFNPSNPDQFFITALVEAQSLFMSSVYETQRDAVFLIVFLVLSASGCAAFFSFILTRPLKKITQEIRMLDDSLDATNFPVNLRDEIGELARAFSDLITKIKQANAELEEFSYRTSHDLRSPLVSSISVLGVVEKELDAGRTETASEGVSYVKDALQMQENLVKDILLLTKIKNVDEPYTKVDFEALVNETCDKFKHMDHFDRLRIEKRFDFKEAFSCKKSRVSLILENLVSNAIKYQDPEKEVSFIKISTYEEAGCFVLEVYDNGLGIPEKDQKNLFQMFKRFHPKVSFGSGLGLYMMKKSADVLGGEIVYENPGDGTIFKLRIPL